MSHAAVRSFDTTSVATIVHGLGAIERVPELVESHDAERVVLVANRSLVDSSDLVGRVKAILGDRLAGVAPPIRSHTPPADVDDVEQFARSVGCEALLAVGGSSVSDGAKVVALRLGGGTPAVVVEDGVVRSTPDAAKRRPIPLIVAPTTLSAGEYNGSAGMVDATRGSKVMSQDPRLRPAAVVLDAELTLSTPAQLWATTGVKAIDHAAETIWGDRSHPVGDALAAESLRMMTRSLPASLTGTTDLDARMECMVAAWMSISTMTNTLIHLSHSLEHSMGAYWHLPHGVTSCIALPVVMEYLASQEPAKVAKVARALDGSLGDEVPDVHAATRGAQWLAGFITDLEVPSRLRDVLPSLSGVEEVASHATHALEYFGYVPPGGEAVVMDLLQRMW